MRILVAGSLKDIPRDPDLCSQFTVALGAQIVKRGHIVLNGCRGSLDEKVAGAAHAWAVENGRDPFAVIIGYCQKNVPRIHEFGTIRYSSLADWNMNHPELRMPEQIELADAAIFVGGREGTFWAKNWAFYARKPIVGIPRFGGAGEVIYTTTNCRDCSLDRPRQRRIMSR